MEIWYAMWFIWYTYHNPGSYILQHKAQGIFSLHLVSHYFSVKTYITILNKEGSYVYCLSLHLVYVPVNFIE